MRKSVLVFCFLIGFLSLAQGQKARYGKTPAKNDPANFPVRVHISSTHQLAGCSGYGNTVDCGPGLFAEAVIDGKKVDLWGAAAIAKFQYAILAPGDYLAQVTQDAHNADDTLISRRYLLLLPDGTTWPCGLSGITE